MKYFCARNAIIEENEVMLPRIPKFINTIYKGKSKVVPLQAQKGPEGSRKLSSINIAAINEVFLCKK